MTLFISILSKLKNKKWYDVEDELVNLICKITGLKDNTYNNKKYEFRYVY